MKVCPVCSREFASGAAHCPDDGVALVALSTADVARPEELIGKIVEGRYRVERIVGRGGMGTVYACRHVVVGKSVALKVLRPSTDRAEGVLQRFIREAQTTNLLKSRHIVEVTDFGQLPNGLFFVVMELLEGRDLTHAMRSGQLSRPDLIHIFIQIAETLGQAHGLGVVHRDLKPDNVFLVTEADDPLFVKLLDFGIAKLLDGGNAGLTETGVILGTPYYMSPEQARADLVDHRTDIYALGVIMYRAFTGRLPFIADSTMGVITRHLSEPPEPPSNVSAVNPKTEVLILRCLEKRPENRPQSMREVAADLRVMLSEEGGASGRRVRDNPTVSERPAAIASSPPIPSMPRSTVDSNPSGQLASGPHGSGPHPSGPHQSGPHQSGPYAQSGPHQSGPHDVNGDPSFQDARAVSARISGPDGIPRHSNPPTFDSALTSVRWPPGTTGSTGRGFVTSSLPTASARPGAWMLLSAILVFAAGAVVAAVFFAIRSGGAPATVASVTVASAAPPVSVAPASAAPVAVTSLPPSPSPPTPATASAAPSVAAAPPRPRGGGVVAPPKPSPSTSPSAKRPTTEIRSPFD